MTNAVTIAVRQILFQGALVRDRQRFLAALALGRARAALQAHPQAGTSATDTRGAVGSPESGQRT